MKSLARLAAAVVATALLAASTTSELAVAGAFAAEGQARVTHQRAVEHDGSAHVLLALGRLDRRLGGALRHRLTPLTATDAAALRSNAVADRSAVESAATHYSVRPTRRHLRAARTLLRSLHPERYVAAAAILRRCARAAGSLAALRGQVDPDSTAASELAVVALLLHHISARRFTARTDRAQLRAARLESSLARGILARVRAELAEAS